MSKRCAVVLTCFLAIVLATRGWSAGPEAVQAPGAADFTNKVLVVNVSDRSGSYIENVKTVKLGDRHFLVGNGIDLGGPHDWSRGKRLFVPIDEISHIVEFDSVDKLKQRLREVGNPPRPENDNRNPRPRGGGL